MVSGVHQARPAGRPRPPCARRVRSSSARSSSGSRCSSRPVQVARHPRYSPALDLDALVVVAYGLILPPAALAAPRLGCFNIHASLLPRWRGAAPIQRALLAGDAVTGITIMRMEAGLDTGPMLAARAVDIEPRDTGGVAARSARRARRELLCARRSMRLRGGPAARDTAARGRSHLRATRSARPRR